MTESVAFPQDRTCPYRPAPGYQPLRDEGPLARARLYDGSTIWVVTGLAEARALLADARLSSDRLDPAFPAVTPRFAEARAKSAVRAPLVGTDDPEHRTQRRMLIPAFGVQRIAALRPRITAVVDTLLDAMERQGPPAELVAAFALPVPSTVICALLGVPYADHEFFEAESRRLLRGPTGEDTFAARTALEEYLGGLIDAKTAGKPGSGEPGLLDELIADRIATGELDRAELVGLAFVLLVAGHETTANMISLGTLTLLQHPERLAELRADPALAAPAVEELLRHLSIADGMLRVATEDVECAGHTIRAGEGVVVATSLINRDDREFPDPDGLSLARGRTHHLAFGYGIHQCLGQNLARAELEIALPALVTRFPGLRLAVPAEEIPHKPGDTIQGLLELPVTW